MKDIKFVNSEIIQAIGNFIEEDTINYFYGNIYLKIDKFSLILFVFTENKLTPHFFKVCKIIVRKAATKFSR